MTTAATIGGWAQRVREILDAQGRSQSWLADYSGVHRSNLSKWLNGKVHGNVKEPNHGERIEIAKALGVPVHHIWPETEHGSS